jgi:hypothetical protein
MSVQSTTNSNAASRCKFYLRSGPPFDLQCRKTVRRTTVEPRCRRDAWRDRSRCPRDGQHLICIDIMNAMIVIGRLCVTTSADTTIPQNLTKRYQRLSCRPLVFAYQSFAQDRTGRHIGRASRGHPMDSASCGRHVRSPSRGKNGCGSCTARSTAAIVCTGASPQPCFFNHQFARGSRVLVYQNLYKYKYVLLPNKYRIIPPIPVINLPVVE